MPDHAVIVSVHTPVPGVDDGDYTQAFRDAGTTFSVKGQGMTITDVPVERAFVLSGTLTTEGHAVYSDLDGYV